MYRVMLRVLHSTGGDVVLKATYRIVQPTKHILAAQRSSYGLLPKLFQPTLSQDSLTQSYFNSCTLSAAIATMHSLWDFICRVCAIWLYFVGSTKLSLAAARFYN